MSYTAPYIDATGLHIPSYQDILDDLIDQAKTIYGSDIYLENDSADYQIISIFALKIYDAFQLAQLIYNNRGPSSAIGSGLDIIIKNNGIARKPASYSTCDVILTGIAGTVITNGIVKDINDYLWTLPSPITIPVGGTITVTVICQTIGAITALATNLSIIQTPTAGWISVSNASAAVPGIIVEADSILRSRQAISTELPSETLVQGTIAGIATLPNVTRYQVYENPTNSTTFGQPGVPYPSAPVHSITCVVEGGVSADIAAVIYNNKSIGCATVGSTTVTVPGPPAIDINFFRPTYVPIFATLTVHPLAGYTTQNTTDIKNAVVAYLNSLQIGEGLTISGLYGAALSIMPNLSLPLFSIQGLLAGIAVGSQYDDDIAIDYNKVTSGIIADITVTIV